MPRPQTARARRPDAWITPATQRRSRERLQAILETATERLNEKPFDEITVAEICRGAGCSPPTFYQRFRDKEALLHALHEKYTAETLELVGTFLDPDVWAQRPVEWLLRALVGGVFHLERRSIGLRITAVRRSHSDPHFAERIRTIRHELYTRLGDCLERLRDQFDHPDPQHAARFLIRLVQGTSVRHLEGLHLEDEPFDPDELVHDVTRMALAYLGARTEG